MNHTHAAYFTDKTIWITGASSGIGEQLAYDLSALGARLILSARRREALDAVKARCTYPEAITVLPLDLGQHPELPSKVAEVLALRGKVDILINNGGISQRSLALDTELAVDKRIMDVDYFGTVALTKALLPSMVQHRIGHILTLTSVSGKLGVAQRTAYCAAKHALHGFMDALRAEVAQYGITVTTVCPGYVRTSIAHNALTATGQSNQRADANIENGMTTTYVSQRIIHALYKRREEVYIGKREIVGIYLMRLWPRQFFRIAKKMARQ